MKTLMYVAPALLLLGACGGTTDATGYHPTPAACDKANAVYAPASALVNGVSDFTPQHKALAETVVAASEQLLISLCPPHALPPEVAAAN